VRPSIHTQIRPVTHHSPYSHSKSVSYAVWYPNLARAHVTVARGVHFTSMGHSAQRPAPSSSPSTTSGRSLKKRLELLPEETLYLVEKGALFCWKAACDDGLGENDVDWDSSSQGAPMSVQQAYAEMIGTQDLTLDRYQVGMRPSAFSPSRSLKPPLYRLSLTFVDLVTS
jgi:tRNA-splicing endonuclease subunit Sen54